MITMESNLLAIFSNHPVQEPFPPSDVENNGTRVANLLRIIIIKVIKHVETSKHCLTYFNYQCIIVYSGKH